MFEGGPHFCKHLQIKFPACALSIGEMGNVKCPIRVFPPLSLGSIGKLLYKTRSLTCITPESAAESRAIESPVIRSRPPADTPPCQPISGEHWGHVTGPGSGWSPGRPARPSRGSPPRSWRRTPARARGPAGTWTNQRSVSCYHGPIRGQYWGSARVRWWLPLG